MMGEYKEKCNEAARKVASNVLEWLAEQHHDRQHAAYFTRASLPDGPTFFTSRVYQSGPGRWRRIFPKKVASITQFMGSIHKPDLQSYDKSVLSYEKLEELMEGVDVQDIWKRNMPSRPENPIIKFLLKHYEQSS